MMKYGIVQGLPDESELVIHGVASLRTGATNPNGDKIAVGSLIKIEMNPQAGAIRVTVKSVFALATSALLQTFKSLLF